MQGIYVHIPYCEAKCFYCDFNSYALSNHRPERYVEALLREIEDTAYRWASQAGSFDTLYFGGGTPTTLTPDQIGRILEKIDQSFSFQRDREITIEANPGTVTLESLKTLRRLGINRISFGVQSFDDTLLKRIGRIHTAQQALEAYTLARLAGFDNVNLDFIYGLPGQTLEIWERTLRQALDLQPEHLSLYALIVEEGTPFGLWYSQGKLALPEEEVQAQMYQLARKLTRQEGYRQYEISNFARPGYECRHNLIYWNNDPYLGFGAGAVSYWEGVRRTNVRHPAKYIEKALKGEDLTEEAETLPPSLALGETLMLGLRMTQGVDLEKLYRRFGYDVLELYQSHIHRMKEIGLLTIRGKRMRLTTKGLILANEVWAGFV